MFPGPLQQGAQLLDPQSVSLPWLVSHLENQRTGYQAGHKRAANDFCSSFVSFPQSCYLVKKYKFDVDERNGTWGSFPFAAFAHFPRYPCYCSLSLECVASPGWRPPGPGTQAGRPVGRALLSAQLFEVRVYPWGKEHHSPAFSRLLIHCLVSTALLLRDPSDFDNLWSKLLDAAQLPVYLHGRLKAEGVCGGRDLCLIGHGEECCLVGHEVWAFLCSHLCVCEAQTTPRLPCESGPKLASFDYLLLYVLLSWEELFILSKFKSTNTY